MTGYNAWAEIDLNAISHNIRGLKRLVKPGVRFMAVVKADAYGHGAVETASRAVCAGADALGVAGLGEALELRHAGIDAPIMIFGKTPPVNAAKLVQYGITQTVCSYSQAAQLSEAAGAAGGKIRVHVKVDTGMGRLGILFGDEQGRAQTTGGRECMGPIGEIRNIFRLKNLACEGIYTHFAAADEADKTMTLRQLHVFEDITGRLEKEGMHFEIRHAANSAAVIDMPQTHFDMVRPGISMYGYYPSKDVDHDAVGLIPAMTLKSRIVQVKKVGPGFPVSYGATEKTGRQTVIATVAIGYADGYPRILSSAGKMTVGGVAVPVIGRVCMDYTMLDAGHVPGVAAGDEVTVFGKPEKGAFSADSIAAAASTINYEILTGVSKRVSRFYY